MQSLFFVIGAVRSGTTVFRLMLDAHPNITNPGESDFIFDHLREDPRTDDWICDLERLQLDRVFQRHNLRAPSSACGRQLVLDVVEQLQKRAPKYLCLVVHGHADKVARVFRDCKIIHLVRDPRDVAYSCIGMGWAGNTYFGVDLWRETEKNWDLAKHLFRKTNILELRFKKLIEHPRAELQRVCSFLDIPFSKSMLNYSNNSNYGPPNPGAIEQWRRNRDRRAIALVEVKVRDLLLDRGYELSGYPLDPPGPLERLRLAWENKAYKWEFGCRRYGPVNFFVEKLTRRLAKPFHPFFFNRMADIDQLHLK